MRETLKYTRKELWVAIDGGRARIGLTECHSLLVSRVEYVELNARQRGVALGDELGVVESETGVADISSPVKGELLAINQALIDKPHLLNEDCYGRGWLADIAITVPNDRLLTFEQYQDWRRIADASSERMRAPFSPEDLIGLVMEGQQFKSILGRGAEGVVYSVMDLDTEREDLVIKVMLSSFSRPDGRGGYLEDD
jgi:glycine cleavage system H protein